MRTGLEPLWADSSLVTHSLFHQGLVYRLGDLPYDQRIIIADVIPAHMPFSCHDG